jgi:hypothetical protein
MENLRYIFLFLSFYLINMTETAAQKTLSYLALGDSYTIGESLPLEDNFPHQTVALLRKKRMLIADPEIVAKTGWTTDELTDAITKLSLKSMALVCSPQLNHDVLFNPRRAQRSATFL